MSLNISILLYGCFLMIISSALTAETLPAVRVGVIGYIGDATNFQALDKKYFNDEGIQVELRHNLTGVQSLKQVIQGEIDIGAVAPTAIVYAAMGRYEMSPDFRIVASILDSTNLNNVVVLDSNSIPTPQHLAGKRLALTKGTASEYFWNVFARANDIDPNSPIKITMDVPEMAAAASRNEFDAAVAWTPFHLSIMNAVDTPAISFSGDNIYTTSWLVVVRPDYLKRYPDRVRAYLRALLRAEKDLHQQPGDVAKVHSRYNGVPADLLADYYSLVHFHLGITESLILNLSQQADWALQEGYAEGDAPNFRSFIDDSILRQVYPQSIKLLE